MDIACNLAMLTEAGAPGSFSLSGACFVRGGSSTSGSTGVEGGANASAGASAVVSSGTLTPASLPFKGAATTSLAALLLAFFFGLGISQYV